MSVSAETSGVTLNADRKSKTHHQTPIHRLYGQKYWDTPFFRTERGTSKTGNKDGKISHVFKNCVSIFIATVLEVSKMSHW